MITILIPLYNSAKDIERLIPSMYPLETDCEILLINDGSTDNTAEVCKKLAAKYSEIVFIDKPHSGVSGTRNVGLRAARGKYILFLDADDKLSKGSVKALADFFDTLPENVDLLTYPIETHYRGHILAPHFRYQTLTGSGVYDLNIHPYIGQTTMNIVVRNRFENNILFDENMTFNEDQKYCCDVMKRSLKMGYCTDAKYIYNRSENSSSGRISGACYIFEQAMKMFEDIFRDYDYVPAAFQGLYINDLAWKLRSNILYPYHYDEKSFEFAVERIKALLTKVDPAVILNHPDINFYHKFYWLSMKPNADVKPFFESGRFGLKLNGAVIYSRQKIEIAVVRIRLDNGNFIFRGFLKSPVFDFTEQPELYAIINGGRVQQELFISAHSYYLCRTMTNRFYGFCFEFSEKEFGTLSFEVRFGGVNYGCTYYFMPKCPFSHTLKMYDSVVSDKGMHYNTNRGEFSTTNKTSEQILINNSHALPANASRIRKQGIALKTKRKIHLYCDCRGVEKDNGYYKFLEDHGKDDGITRKYICDPSNKNISKLFTKNQLKDVIPFGSKSHKIHFLAAEKIFTAFIEDINLFPFEPFEFDMYSDFFGFEVVYLQHGVLHGSLPWKYTPEVITADKVCISTDYEQRLFSEKYHFVKADIIREPMYRLTMLDRTAPHERKILFAPSWRQYLIGPDIDGVWQPLPEVFQNSDYFNGISELLNSAELEKLLEENDYTLDFKLHPIFAYYESFFMLRNKRVRLVHETDSIEKYEKFITDFSSFAFDFLYLGRQVYSYIPDEMQFRCGMNSYREIEPESEKMFLKICGTCDLGKLFEENVLCNDLNFY